MKAEIIADGISIEVNKDFRLSGRRHEFELLREVIDDLLKQDPKVLTGSIWIRHLAFHRIWNDPLDSSK